MYNSSIKCCINHVNNFEIKFMYYSILMMIIIAQLDNITYVTNFD